MHFAPTQGVASQQCKWFIRMIQAGCNTFIVKLLTSHSVSCCFMQAGELPYHQEANQSNRPSAKIADKYTHTFHTLSAPSRPHIVTDQQIACTLHAGHSLGVENNMRVDVLVEERLKLVGHLEVDGLRRVVYAGVGAHAVDIRNEDVQRDIVVPALQPLLDHAQVHWILFPKPASFSKTAPR